MTAPPTGAFDALAALIGYPDAALPLRVDACLASLAVVSPAAAAELASFRDAIAGTTVAGLQEQYTDAFDLTPTCALDLGWHLFGDAHERGGFMAALRDDLERAGVPETSELPDHLTHVLRLLAREAPARAAALAGAITPAVETVRQALADGASPYVHVLAAIGAVVASLAECDREVMHS